MKYGDAEKAYNEIKKVCFQQADGRSLGPHVGWKKMCFKKIQKRK